VSGVGLADGSVLPADLVVMAVGVRARISSLPGRQDCHAIAAFWSTIRC